MARRGAEELCEWFARAALQAALAHARARHGRLVIALAEEKGGDAVVRAFWASAWRAGVAKMDREREHFAKQMALCRAADYPDAAAHREKQAKTKHADPVVARLRGALHQRRKKKRPKLVRDDAGNDDGVDVGADGFAVGSEPVGDDDAADDRADAAIVAAAPPESASDRAFIKDEPSDSDPDPDAPHPDDMQQDKPDQQEQKRRPARGRGRARARKVSILDRIRMQQRERTGADLADLHPDADDTHNWAE